MARALVLGATGHIGSHVVRALLAEGHAVRAAFRQARFLWVLDGLPVERVHIDLETLEGLSEALAGCEWVFHAAAYYPRFQARRPHALAQGVHSTQRILDAISRASPSRLVFTSSASAIQRRPEPSVAYPLYAAVKIAIEREVQQAAESGMPIVIVNPSVCLGEYDAHAFSGRAILAFAKHRLPVYLDQSFDAIYTGDVGMGHVRAAERGRVGARYALSCRRISVKEFATLVAQAAGAPPPRIRVPYHAALAFAAATEALAWLTRREPLLPRQAVMTTGGHGPLDVTAARTELGLPQTPIEDAIRRAVSWFRAHGYVRAPRSPRHVRRHGQSIVNSP